MSRRKFISFILLLMYSEKKAKDRSGMIIQWFQDRPDLGEELVNDIFFGCGYMLFNRYYLEGYLKNKYKNLPKLNSHNKDFLF